MSIESNLWNRIDGNIDREAADLNRVVTKTEQKKKKKRNEGWSIGFALMAYIDDEGIGNNAERSSSSQLNSIILLTIIDTVGNVDTNARQRNIPGTKENQKWQEGTPAVDALLEKFQPQLHQFRIGSVQILTLQA